MGNIILFHRKTAGLTQKDLADLAGVGKTVIFDIEKGKETIKWSTIQAICKALNISFVLTSPIIDKYRSNETSNNLL